MDLDDYRFYRNRPEPLMGCPIVYAVPDNALAELPGDYLKRVIQQEYPNAKDIKTLRHGSWTYVGVIEVDGG